MPTFTAFVSDRKQGPRGQAACGNRFESPKGAHQMTFRIAILVFFAGSMGLAPPVDEPINVGSRLELFVDDYLIDRMTTAVLELQHPTPRELSMVYDKPWDGNDCTYHTVFQDGEVYPT